MSGSIPEDAYAMIVGAMKCGTSSLYYYLQGHWQICAASNKEPEFFSENQGHGAKVCHYNDLFDFDNSVHKYTLEASTGYTKYPQEPNVAKKIFDYGICPKIIYIIRNPFERIESHYNFMAQNEELWSLAVDDSYLISLSDYFLQLEQYRQYFALENILILDFDDLKTSPVALLKKTYEFLELSHGYLPESLEAKNRTPIISKYEMSMARSNIAPVFGYIPKPLKELCKRILRKAAPHVKRTLTERQKEFVRDRLKDGMSNLHKVYGFNVGKWGFCI